jgi:hypothetical protein
MPIAAFNHCLCGELEAVSKNKYYDPIKAIKAWEKLFNDFIETHGLPENYHHYMTKMRKALDHYEKTYDGQRWQIIKAKVYEAEALQFLMGESEDIKLTCAKISKFLGFPIKANEVSVNEFYSYIKLIQNG